MFAKKISLVSGVLVIVMISVALAQRETPIKSDSGNDQVVEAMRVSTKVNLIENPLSRFSLFFADDGKLMIAGVVDLEFNDMGQAIVEVQPDGDFERDTVLTLNVPIRVASDGTTSSTGIQAISSNRQNIVLTLELQVQGVGGIANGHTRGRDDCHMEITFPGNETSCTGGCPISAPNCDFTFQGGSIICNCLPDSD